MARINSTPSADLATRFARAKKAALDGKMGKVTVLAVSLVDVKTSERGESGKKPMDYSSFAHTFVLGIAREGWRIFQAWGEHEYTLDKYFDCGGACLRDWKEAKSFLKAFGVLASAEVCFVGTHSLSHRLLTVRTRDHGPRRSMTRTKSALRSMLLGYVERTARRGPSCQSIGQWARMFGFENVKVADIAKFIWG